MADGIMSGPPIKLRNGWARMPMVGMKAHFWREDRHTMEPTIGDGGRVRYYEALCGVLGAANDRIPMLNEGNWPRCKRCERKQRSAP